MTKLQLALDTLSFDAALTILDQVHTQIDIIEAGTPFVLHYGVEAVRSIKRRFPSLQVLCDGKIMDAGSFESKEMFEAGADWVTVMAFTDSTTIAECVETARLFGKKVMADLLCVPDIPQRVAELERLGVDCIAVHTGVDQQKRGQTPLDDLRILKRCARRAEVAVAGGISLETLDAYLALEPDIVIVGGGILNQPNPAEIASAFRERLG